MAQRCDRDAPLISEILSWTDAQLFDLIISPPGGVAVVVAAAHVGAVIAGVVAATSRLPPLAATGLLQARGGFDLAWRRAVALRRLRCSATCPACSFTARSPNRSPKACGAARAFLRRIGLTPGRCPIRTAGGFDDRSGIRPGHNAVPRRGGHGAGDLAAVAGCGWKLRLQIRFVPTIIMMPQEPVASGHGIGR